jgi:hypothetical protein
LKDYPMPLFAEEASPLYAPSKNEVAPALAEESRRIIKASSKT